MTTEHDTLCPQHDLTELPDSLLAWAPDCACKLITTVREQHRDR